MSLLARDMAIMSYFTPIDMLVTAEALSSVVAHFLDNYKFYSPSRLPSYFFVQRQNFPILLPIMTPLEKGQRAVISMFSWNDSLKTL